jgi:dTDP-4-dehydrorhamnose reductase
MMKTLVIGCHGQLGWELQRSLLPLGQVIAVDYPEVDLSAPESLLDLMKRFAPHAVINAAAYTDVDLAENESEKARRINAIAPGILAEAARDLGAIFIHFSTDYVFDGRGREPYREGDSPSPINEYGRSKLEGERAVLHAGGEVFIFRTSWLYSTRRDCFLTKLLNWARTQQQIRVAADQIASPTWCVTLADAVTQALVVMQNSGKAWREKKSGVYHLAGIGAVNRFDWAKKILELDPHAEEHIYQSLERANSSDFSSPAQRPQYSALDCSHFQSTFNTFYCDWLSVLATALRP